MKKILLIMILSFLTAVRIFSQDTSNVATKDDVAEVKGAVDGLNESFLETKSTVDALKKIKVSGYIQAQWQVTDRDGASSFAGGNFPSTSHDRFLLRRGRIKINYDNDLTQYVLQFDVSEKGFGTKDAYVSFREPWLKTFELWGGIFNRPFGFEIEYSSSNRESPERSRLFQTLFPGERDLGAKLEIRPQSGPLSFFNLKAGMFAGNGINPENDNNKDFIGRVGFSFPFTDENLAIDGGVSAYVGKVYIPNNLKIFTVDNASLPSIDSVKIIRDADRTYIGADLQVYYDLPVIGGFSLRGEFISGKQPSTSSSTTSFTSAASGDVYLRKFMGYYLMYVQNLGSSDQLVVKYDVYDPNTSVSGDEIGLKSASKIGAADVKYSTLGLGLVHYWDANVKLVLYYDMVKNEKVNAAATGSLASFKDDLKDNVLTFRIQYKF
jgi:hypothetical protein